VALGTVMVSGSADCGGVSNAGKKHPTPGKQGAGRGKSVVVVGLLSSQSRGGPGIGHDMASTHVSSGLT
jgi:hypothetical protein